MQTTTIYYGKKWCWTNDIYLLCFEKIKVVILQKKHLYVSILDLAFWWRKYQSWIAFWSRLLHPNLDIVKTHHRAHRVPNGRVFSLQPELEGAIIYIYIRCRHVIISCRMPRFMNIDALWQVLILPLKTSDWRSIFWASCISSMKSFNLSVCAWNWFFNATKVHEKVTKTSNLY